MAESQYALELKGVTKKFDGLTAVSDVTFRLEPGERRGILGPNGAGKTTLFHLITGVLPLTSGEVLMYGEDVSEWTTHRRVAMGMARTF